MRQWAGYKEATPAMQCAYHLLKYRTYAGERMRRLNQSGCPVPEHPEIGYIGRPGPGIQHNQKQLDQEAWIHAPYIEPPMFNSRRPVVYDVSMLRSEYPDPLQAMLNKECANYY